jgi:hypothetical protein
MPSSPSDTDSAAERALLDAIRRAPIWKRIALVSELVETTRALALADLRTQFPSASPEELRRRLALRILTPEEIRTVYGWDPESLEA